MHSYAVALGVRFLGLVSYTVDAYIWDGTSRLPELPRITSRIAFILTFAAVTWTVYWSCYVYSLKSAFWLLWLLFVIRVNVDVARNTKHIEQFKISK